MLEIDWSKKLGSNSPFSIYGFIAYITAFYSSAQSPLTCNMSVDSEYVSDIIVLSVTGSVAL